VPGTVKGTTIPEDPAGPVPAELVAVTVMIYVEPLFSAESMQVKAPVVVQMDPPGVAVAVYPVMTAPPLENGAVHDTTTLALPGVAITPVGALGAPTGVTAFEETEAALLPAALVATTVKVYATPLVNILSTQLDPVEPVVEHVLPSGLEVTIYPVIAEPFAVPLPKVIVARPLPATAEIVVGGLGVPTTGCGVTVGEAAEAGPVPTELVAVTVKLYAVPLVRPVTVQVKAGVAGGVEVVPQCLLVSCTAVTL
jgi:hypothetical protein